MRKDFILGFVFGLAVGFILVLSLFTPLFEEDKNKSIPVIPASVEKNENIKEIQIPVLAVSNIGEGKVGLLKIKSIPGSGKALLATNPFNEIDLQFSAQRALESVKEILKIKNLDRDFILYFDIEGEVIGGESAGLPIALGIASLILDKKIKAGMAATGRILNEGKIGKVGAVLEKAKAASNAGIKLLLIPADTKVIIYETKLKEEKGKGFYYREERIIPKEVDFKNYAKDLGIEVKEVSNLAEALEIALI